jgi:galactokinase
VTRDELLDMCLSRLGRGDGIIAFFVPGRIEVLGKHTDYAGGRSLLCALDRGICIAARPRADDVLDVTDARTRTRATFQLSAALEPGNGWARYAGTVARRIARDLGPLRGADIAFTGNLPMASGMSSSAALVIAIYLIIATVNELSTRAVYRENIDSDDALAEYLSGVENGRAYRGFAGDAGVGTHGGSEDHTAILCGRAHALVQYRFAPVRFERVITLPADHVFALGSSGVVAEKAAGALALYNNAAEQLRVAADVWRAATGRDDAVLGSALLGDDDAVQRMRRALEDTRQRGFAPDLLLARVEQFVEESNRIIPGAADALAARDMARFGELVDRSHHLAVTVLRNQIDETIHLAERARALGALAASAFGAGFGGSVWALVRAADASAFLEDWARSYHDRFPQHDATSAFFLSPAAEPAARLI